MMRPLVALLLGLLLSAAHFASPASAQPGGIIRGVVTDERTGAPIEGATVRVNRPTVRSRQRRRTRAAFTEFSDLPASQVLDRHVSKFAYVLKIDDGFQCLPAARHSSDYCSVAVTIIANAALEPLHQSADLRDAALWLPSDPEGSFLSSFYNVDGSGCS